MLLSWRPEPDIMGDMRQDQVERLLREDPDRTKEISLNDGRQYRVAGRERWLAGPILSILDVRGEMIHIAYHNIASIRILRTNGKRRRSRRS
jgi:hypothetical protein